MTIVSGETQLKNFTMDVLLLAKGSRVTTRVNIVSGGAAEGAGTINLSSPTGAVFVNGGNSLSFLNGNRRVQVLVLADVTITTAPTAVSVSELTDGVDSGAIAVYIQGLLPLAGVQDFALSTSDQEVDTTNVLSGYGTESALIRAGKTFNVSFIQIPNDAGLYSIVKRVALQGAFYGREVYAVATFPDGEIHRGAAKVKNFSQPGNQNEVKKGSFDLEFQGISYEFISPFPFAV